MKVGLAFLLWLGVVAGAVARPPNIIVFLTDDQDKYSIGAYGGKSWTPNLDRMAAEGAVFHNAFVTSTVCTPSRYSFLTGRYASRSTSSHFLEECPPGSQANPVFNMMLEQDGLNIGAVLRSAGYRTGYVGKYHVGGIEGLKSKEDYDRYNMMYPGKTPETATEAFRTNERITSELIRSCGFDWVKNTYIGNLQDPFNHHNLEWTIDAALEFIEASKDQPFYLHFCTTLVHGPEGSWNRSIKEPLISGAGLLEAPIEPEGMLSRKAILAELERRGLDPDAGHAGYAWVDAGVGAIFTKLKKLGLDRDTLVIFTSDHGSNRKSSLFDIDGCCVPFIARWPNGIAPGTIRHELVQNIDVAATAFDLADARLPETYPLDGRSLRPLLEGKKPAEWRDHLYFELGPGRAIRTPEFKYIAIRYPAETVARLKQASPQDLPKLMSLAGRLGIGTRGAENPNFFSEDALFNIRSDPQELKNLALDPEYGPQLARMKNVLVAELESLGRPYGELRTGGNAADPGQLDPQFEMVRKLKIQGKNVVVPGDAESGESASGKKKDEGKRRNAKQK